MSKPTIKFRYQNKKKYTLRVPSLDDHISKMIQRRQAFYEHDLLERIAKMRLPGMYIDIGAHIGNHSVFFARHTECSHVVAVEADPKLAEICEDNLSRYAKSYEVHARACYDGLPVRVEKLAAGNSGMQAVRTDFEGEPSMTLADVVGDRSVALIKIDIEGGEPVVLHAGMDLLKKQRPVLVIESRTEAELADTKATLAPLGYKHEGPYAITPTYLWRCP